MLLFKAKRNSQTLLILFLLSLLIIKTELLTVTIFNVRLLHFILYF